MNILLGITGSIAATLTEKLVAELARLGNVRIVVTESARKILDHQDYDKLYEITNSDVYLDEHEWSDYRHKKEVLHIELRKWADVLVVAPLSANTLAKFSNGLCDNLLTNVFRAWDFQKRVIVAPAMNTYMWDSNIIEDQILKLTSMGVEIVKPIGKILYCGDQGVGAMAQISDIVSEVAGKWKFPIKCNGIPINHHPGAFGFNRKKNHHTGVDLYCEDNAQVFAVEDGIVVNVDVFTGPKLGHDWWEETFAIMIEGLSGVVNYGEIWPTHFKVGDPIKKGECIGNVKRVLFKDKFRPDIPGHSTSMLHLELYKHETKEFADWHDPVKNSNLLDPTKYLMEADGSPKNILTWENSDNKEVG